MRRVVLNTMQKAFFVLLFAALALAGAGCAQKMSETEEPRNRGTEEQQNESTEEPKNPGTELLEREGVEGRTPAMVSKVKIFLVAIDDNGETGKKIGCGDSIVAVTREITPTAAPLTAAMRELVALKAQYYGESGLYHALHASTLAVDHVSIKDGKAIIKLSGTLSLGGVCDAPRVEAQIKETALQFSTVKEVVIFINGVPLSQALSGKGE